MTILTAPEELGQLLSDAYLQPAAQVHVPARLDPVDQDGAYRAQQAFLQRHRFDIGGWKIGAKSADGPIQGAPLPRRGIHAGAAVLARSDFAAFGIELEIMFRFDRDFLPGAPAASEAQVLSSIGGIGAAIEIVSSRLAGWPDGPKLTQLADLQNHGALVIGEFIDYRDDVDFINPAAHLQFDGRDLFSGPAANPAGDPRRLLHWLVKHCNAQNIALPAGTVVTAGSYTGIYFAKEPGKLTGQIAGLPPVSFDIR